MKIKNLLLIGALSMFAFTACKDENKKDDMDDADDMEMNDETAEMDDMDEMDAENDADYENEMDADANENEMNLAQVAMASQDHSTLVSAIQGAGMVTKLETEGPYTIFAPTNSAFNELPKGTVEELMKPENKEKLEAVLSYHIIPGNVTAMKLKELIKSNKDNEYELVTANDGKLMATVDNSGNVILTDGRGKKATVVAADMNGSNGVIHSINSVLMRK
ncbi:fasciclin domain-containing protein [Mesonia maritima]|uniref:Surface protein with fasciclin (FAS1) repeats n=1 Tax=Mesonia maritima TaxID=1793873 RepID=A0ABU1KAA3_9FLAO|nr:fasciclin domain-containing protein [Mesonia maritima]MDR6302226.1 putative surface protein with fasciclin (FAS1) repeats [Mesonia maritima]